MSETLSGSPAQTVNQTKPKEAVYAALQSFRITLAVNIPRVLDK
jgi:hypothetical protein